MVIITRPLRSLTMSSEVGVLLLTADRSSASPSTALLRQLLFGLFLPTESPVDSICRKGFRVKITKPLTDLLMTRVIGVPNRIEKLCKSLRPATVFGWTTSLTRHTNLLKRFLCNQDSFNKKLVLPAIPEIVLIQ